MYIDDVYEAYARPQYRYTCVCVYHTYVIREILSDHCQTCLQENHHCFLVVTPAGGHLGWVAGSDAPFGAPWTDPLVMDYLDILERSAKSNMSLLEH